MTAITQGLYLTKLLPNMRSRRVRQLLANPGALYGTLLRAVGEDRGHHGDTGTGRALLYRVEEARSSVAPCTILVQTACEPDWLLVEGEDGVPLLHGSHVRELRLRRDDGTSVFEEGQLLRFRLCANPTISVPQPRGATPRRPRGQPRPIYGQAAQIEWLKRKFEGVASVEDARGQDLGEINLQRQSAERGQSVPVERSGRLNRRPAARLLGVRFEGLLRVENPELLIETIAQGVGRGRAFGLGLLSVARA